MTLQTVVQNIPTLLGSVVVAAIVIAVIVTHIKKRKNGQGGCNGCSSCVYHHCKNTDNTKEKVHICSM